MNVGGNLEVHGTDGGDFSSVLVSDSLAELNVAVISSSARAAP